MKISIAITGLVAAVLLGACASTPENISQLDEARNAVQSFAQEPEAAQVASRELQAARGALESAEAAFEEGRPREEVIHLAYVAQRHAQIGRERLQEAQARQVIAKAEAERNRVLLEARTQEAEQRAAMAEAAKSKAQMAQEELQRTQEQLAQLQAKQTERGMVVTLGDVLFDTDKAVLKPGADQTIDRLAAFMRDNPDTRIIVEGHTDSRGSDAHNEALSRRRAQAVADALVARGIPTDRFEIMGRGEGYPVASNDTAEGRQRNRRVEIVFSDASGRFAEGAERPTLR